ncbi:unnamed protein product, partial [Brachionus calyciflorus]
GWDFIDSLKHWTQIDKTSGQYRIDKKLDDEKKIENNINLKGIKQELIKIYESVSENIKFYILIILIAISVIMIIIAIIYFIKINKLLKWSYKKKKIQNERLDKINNDNKEIIVCEDKINITKGDEIILSEITKIKSDGNSVTNLSTNLTDSLDNLTKGFLKNLKN